MQSFEVSNERSSLMKSDKKTMGRKWKVGGIFGIVLVVGVVLMVGYGGEKSDGMDVVATQEHLEQHDMDTQNFDAADMSVPEMDTEGDNDDENENENENVVDEDAEADGSEEPEIVADGVNIIKLSEDKYKYVNFYKCPPGLYKIPIKYGKKGSGCVCKLCPYGYRCPGNNKKYICSCGFYQPKKGQRKCFKANCGYYVPKKGSWYKIKCNYGTYSFYRKKSKGKNCFCRKSRPGWYVPKMGACGPSKCKAGTSQHCYGQRFCIPCGTYESSKYGAKICTKKYPKYPKYY